MSATGIPSICPSREVTLGRTIAVALASTAGICSCGSAPRSSTDLAEPLARDPRLERAAELAVPDEHDAAGARPRSRRSRTASSRTACPLYSRRLATHTKVGTSGGARPDRRERGEVDAAADDVDLARRERRRSSPR